MAPKQINSFKIWQEIQIQESNSYKCADKYGFLYLLSFSHKMDTKLNSSPRTYFPVDLSGLFWYSAHTI